MKHKKIGMTPIQFIKLIGEDLDKYVLVNDSFICKYLNAEECIYIGDFVKPSMYDKKRGNYIVISKMEHRQRFKPLALSTHTRGDIQNKYPTVNFWKPLNIKFREEHINAILK